MEVTRKETTYTISADPDTGWQNEMKLTFEEGGLGIAASYSLHHWHDDLNDLAGKLERMAAALRAFKPTH